MTDTKEITGRIAPDLWEELHHQAYQRRLSKNKAIIEALTLWVKKKPAALDPARREQGSTGQTQGPEIIDRLDTLLSGQKEIAHQIHGLHDKLTIALGQQPIPVEGSAQLQSQDEQISGVPLDLAGVIGESIRGPERPSPAPKARPRKQKTIAPPDPGRRAR